MFCFKDPVGKKKKRKTKAPQKEKQERDFFSPAWKEGGVLLTHRLP